MSKNSICLPTPLYGDIIARPGMVVTRFKEDFALDQKKGQTRGRVSSSAIVLAVACFGWMSAASAQQSDGVGWSITPYLWTPTTKIDLTLRDAAGIGGELKFKDLLDTLDAAFMGQVEGGRGNWSAFGDLNYLKTSDTVMREIFTIDTRSKQKFFDAALAYWPGGYGSQFNVFGGLRFSALDDHYTFTTTANDTLVGQRRSSNDYYDALLGVRYRFDFSDRWQLLTHGDYSFGDSEGVVILRANFAYTVGKRQQNRILFGYQYKDSEFKEGDLKTAFTLHGPMAGFNFRF